MKRKLVKSYPFKRITCNERKCAVCKIDPRINCKKRGVVYQIACGGVDSEGNSCSATYIGESARSIAERIEEHVCAYDNKRETSVFAQHINEKHDGIHQDLKLSILATCPADAMLRQITEATYIKEFNPDLNMKEEWGNSNIPRARKEKSTSSHF